MSKGIEELKDFMRSQGHVFTGDEENAEKNQRGVDAILTRGQFKRQQPQKYADVLTREMMKSVDR